MLGNVGYVILSSRADVFFVVGLYRERSSRL
jgi:hypothetical protein